MTGSPEQVTSSGPALAVGNGLTTSTTESRELHPFAVNPVTKNVVVESGAAIGDEQFVQDNPTAGVHRYSSAPSTVNGTESPEHTVTLSRSDRCGASRTRMVIESIRRQPAAFLIAPTRLSARLRIGAVRCGISTVRTSPSQRSPVPRSSTDEPPPSRGTRRWLRRVLRHPSHHALWIAIEC